MPYKDKEVQRAKNKEYQKKHYKSKTGYYKAKAKVRRTKMVTEFNELKQTLKCSRCPENHVSCLDFHHRDPNEKTINVGDAVRRGWSITRIVEEITKCDILCANCHRKLHYEENTVGRAGAPFSLIS